MDHASPPAASDEPNATPFELDSGRPTDSTRADFILLSDARASEAAVPPCSHRLMVSFHSIDKQTAAGGWIDQWRTSPSLVAWPVGRRRFINEYDVEDFDDDDEY